MSVCMHQGGHKETCNACYRNLRAENARLQERVADKIAVIDVAAAAAVKLVRERDALQARVEEAEADRRRAFSLIVSYSDERDEARALAEQRKKALEEYGKHGLGCTFGLLPAGVHRQSFSNKENERLKRASIKECTCGFRAAIDITPEEAKEKEGLDD